MSKQINYNIGFADAEIISYNRTQENLTVKVKTWNDKYLLVTFFETVGLTDYGIGDISDFIVDDIDNEFLKTVLKNVYDQIPTNHSFRLFRFLNLDDCCALEIVAVAQQISEIS